jgi:hypothetical protein
LTKDTPQRLTGLNNKIDAPIDKKTEKSLIRTLIEKVDAMEAVVVVTMKVPTETIEAEIVAVEEETYKEIIQDQAMIKEAPEKI